MLYILEIFCLILNLNIIFIDLQTNTIVEAWNGTANSTNPYDFEINNLLYIDPASKYIYAKSSSKGSLNDCISDECKDSYKNDTNIVDQILSTYNNEEVDNNEFSSELCRFGQLQSPINIQEASSFKPAEFSINYSLDISKIQWRPFYKKHNFGVENVSPCLKPHLIINSPTYNLHNKGFCLRNIHIHLSCDKNTLGSEHAVQFEKFNAELHLVYTAAENSTSVFEEDNQFVIYEAIFLRMSNSADLLTPLDKLLRSFINYNTTNDNSDFENLKMNELVELNNIFNPTHTPLYVYRGSITSAPCTEYILWMILKYPAIISYKTLEQLRNSRIESLKLHMYSHQESETSLTQKSAPLKLKLKCDNFRPLQRQIKQQVRISNANTEQHGRFKLLNLP